MQGNWAVIFMWICIFKARITNCSGLVKTDEKRPLAMHNFYENALQNADISGPEKGAFAPPRLGLSEHCAVLFIGAAILILSSVLGINADGKVYLPPFSGYGWPTLCATKALFHRDCAGCGITRSLISLGHGDWRASLAFHPAGIAFYIFLWAEVPFRVSALRGAKKGLLVPRNRFLNGFGCVVAAAFLATGIYRFWPR